MKKAPPEADQPQPINLGLICPLADSAETVRILDVPSKTIVGREK
jgi:hypothetical protein